MPLLGKGKDKKKEEAVHDIYLLDGFEARKAAEMLAYVLVSRAYLSKPQLRAMSLAIDWADTDGWDRLDLIKTLMRFLKAKGEESESYKHRSITPERPKKPLPGSGGGESPT